MRTQRANIRDLDSGFIIEMLEIHGLVGAARTIGCSWKGLLYQMKRRGIERPPPNPARTSERARQAALRRYGYGNQADLIVLIQELAQGLGRRPKVSDLGSRNDYPSKDPFVHRFGSWTKALEAAGFHAQRAEKRKQKKRATPPTPFAERIYKSITPKLRFAVLERDGFKCVYCGRSPIEHGIMLQVDHVVPKSKGGPTTYKNLVTSCIECNIGKGNSFSTDPNKGIGGHDEHSQTEHSTNYSRANSRAKGVHGRI